MDAQKMVELQQQLRESQTDVHDFLKDLDSWETDIKSKDEKLKTQKPDQNNSNLPPVRNSLEQKRKKKKKKKPKPIEAVKTEKKRISGYDYRSWDKFDVDKELESASDKSDDEYETDEEWEILRKKQQANVMKEQGNQFFKEGKYDDAIECYTRGINCDETNAVLAANRAMALIKQEKFAAAELDCTAAINIDSHYVKAYQRRATSRKAMKKYEEAKKDIQQVLKLEPNNKQFKAELEKIEMLLHPTLLQTHADEDIAVVKPIHKPQQARSKVPLKRIRVEEIGLTEDEAKKAAAAAALVKAGQSEATRKIAEKDNEMFNKFTTPASPADIKSLSSHSEMENTIQIEESEKRGESSLVEEIKGKQVHEDKSCFKLDLQSEPASKPKKMVSTPVSSPQTSPRVPPCPTSSYQFQADWKQLRNTSEQFYQYFKQINPQSYQKLFGEALDGYMLTKIFSTLHEHFIPSEADVFPILSSLVSVKRFGMTVMFMSSKEKEDIRKLFHYMRANTTGLSVEIDKLYKKYEL